MINSPILFTKPVKLVKNDFPRHPKKFNHLTTGSLHGLRVVVKILINTWNDVHGIVSVYVCAHINQISNRYVADIWPMHPGLFRPDIWNLNEELPDILLDKQHTRDPYQDKYKKAKPIVAGQSQIRKMTVWTGLQRQNSYNT